MKHRVLFVDVADKSAAAFWWRSAARAFSASFHDVVECKTPEDVYAYLRRTPVGSIEHAQFWGHGNPGRALIAGQPLDANRAEWGRAAGASLWFRMCRVAQGLKGQHWLAHLARHGCHPVAHISKVGGPLLSQSYLVGFRAGAVPWWDADLAPQGSAPWAPRSVGVLAMDLPSWAFEPGRGVA